MKQGRDDRWRPCELCNGRMPLKRTLRICAHCIAAREVMRYRELLARAEEKFRRAVKTCERFTVRTANVPAQKPDPA
jgi:hypothetical protein